MNLNYIIILLILYIYFHLIFDSNIYYFYNLLNFSCLHFFNSLSKCYKWIIWTHFIICSNYWNHHIIIFHLFFIRTIFLLLIFSFFPNTERHIYLLISYLSVPLLLYTNFIILYFVFITSFVDLKTVSINSIINSNSS